MNEVVILKVLQFYYSIIIIFLKCLRAKLPAPLNLSPYTDFILYLS